MSSSDLRVVITGGSSGTFDIDVELEGLTELQSGSYCVMDLDYRRIGAKGSKLNSQFELALTVLTTVVSRPSAELAIVDGGFKAFSTDRPFPPEAVTIRGSAEITEVAASPFPTRTAPPGSATGSSSSPRTAIPPSISTIRSMPCAATRSRRYGRCRGAGGASSRPPA